MLREGETRKTYLTLALGPWRDPVRHVRLALHKYTNDAGERRVVAEEGGQHAHTIFRLLRQAGEFTLLEAELKTGRTHQIRVHLSTLGHPIAGDSKYGDFELNRSLNKRGLKRLFLHAKRLEMSHPITGIPLCFESPLAADLEGFLASLP